MVVSLRNGVSRDSDIGHVRREVADAARRIGFSPSDLDRLAVVATEPATNPVKHDTLNGQIVVTPLNGSGRGGADEDDRDDRGIELVSVDDGPGIADAEAALRECYSTAGTLGCGLGAVRRLADEFDLYSRADDRGLRPAAKLGYASQGGTVVVARKWVTPPTTRRPFSCSASSIPRPGEVANGDAFAVTEDARGIFVAVADGLGHGPDAEGAGRVAIDHVLAHANRDMESIFAGLHRELRGTRGAAVTLVRLSFAERTLTHAGVGNVEAHLFPNSRATLISRPGVLGSGLAPNLRITTTAWPERVSDVSAFGTN